MMRHNRPRLSLLGGSLAVLALLLAPAASAQEQDTKNDSEQTQNQDQKQDQQQQRSDRAQQSRQGDQPRPADRDRPRQGRRDRPMARSNQGQGQRGAALLIPEGWISIATDYDNDGRFDAVETIYAFDLLQARRASAERRQAGALGRQGREAARTIRISGTVRDIATVPLAGFDTEHKVARVETEQGRVAKVDLGPSDQLQDLKIKDGDTVTILGSRGMINDRPVLMARRIRKGERQATIDRPHDRYLKRVRGKVVSTRTARFRGRDQEHVIARVKLRSGREAPVILGPKSKVGNLSLSGGDEVAMLVRPARLNGRQAMVAEQVRSGDQTIEIQKPVSRRPKLKSQDQSDDQTQQKQKQKQKSQDQGDQSGSKEKNQTR